MSDLRSELRAARVAAQDAVETIRQEKEDAHERGDHAGFDRAAAALPRAIEAETEATRRLQREILNPSIAGIASLKDGTAELKDRIARFKADAATMGDIAVGISILTNAITLFRIV